jgi:hypothetical protein
MVSCEELFSWTLLHTVSFLEGNPLLTAEKSVQLVRRMNKSRRKCWFRGAEQSSLQAVSSGNKITDNAHIFLLDNLFTSIWP